MSEFHFSVLDYVVFVGILVLSGGVGVYYALRSRFSSVVESTDSYLMGGRRLPLIPVALSLTVSFTSAILVLGTSAEVYTRGTTYWWASVGVSVSVLFTIFIFVPVFYYLELTSVYELMYLSIAIYAPSVALAAVTPIPLWVLILSAGAVCTFYVYCGGIKAVIWTDALQAGFMVAGLLAVAIKGTMSVGGVANVWQTSREHGRLIYFDNRVNPFVYMTSWGIIIGQLYSWLGWFGINQSSVQRYCGMKSAAQGQLALLLNIPTLVVMMTLVVYCGLVMATYFRHCDPLRAGLIGDKDELLPLFVMEVLGSASGVPGLFVACLYAGTLSTVSSGLNSLAAVAWQDFLEPFFRQAGDQRTTNITRLLCFGFGCLSTALAFLSPYLGGVLQAALSTMGAINGPLTGLFLLGISFPWANKKGAMAGALVAIAFSTWLCVGALLTSPHSDSALPTDVDQCDAMYNVSLPIRASTPVSLLEPQSTDILMTLYSTSYALYDLIGITIVFVVAIPVSYFTGFEDISQLNPKLFHPLLRSFAARVGGQKWRRSSSAKTKPMKRAENKVQEDVMLLQQESVSSQ